MRIFIPSTKRAERQITIKSLPTASIVVPQSQVEEYHKHNPQANIIGLPDKIKGIRATRQAILELAGKKKLLMVDDDIIFHRRQELPSKFRRTDASGAALLLKEIEASLDEYAHVGISDKFMSHVKPRGHTVGGKYATISAYNPKLFPEPPPRFRIETNEDIDFLLQLSTQGCYPKVLTEWTFETRWYAPGGCSTWRTPEVEHQALLEFAKLWPGIVRIQRAPNKLCGYKPVCHWPKPQDGRLL